MNSIETPDDRGFTVTPRRARVYVHHHCGTATQVSGSDFSQLCNPYSIAMATICVNCGPVSLGSVAWEETGESLAAYRARLRGLMPAWMGLLPLWLPLVLAGIGYAAGWLTAEGLKDDHFVCLVYAAVGGIAGLIVGLVARPFLLRGRLGVNLTDID